MSVNEKSVQRMKALIGQLKAADIAYYPSAQRHTMNGLEIEPYDVDFKVASVICMYAMNNRSLADSYYLKIEADLTDAQRETIKSYQQTKSKLEQS